MLPEEETDINLPPHTDLDLMKRQPRQNGYPLHQEISKQLDPYHSIYPFPSQKADFVYLQLTLQPPPKLLYTMMLLPYGYHLLIVF